MTEIIFEYIYLNSVSEKIKKAQNHDIIQFENLILKCIIRTSEACWIYAVWVGCTEKNITCYLITRDI